MSDNLFYSDEEIECLLHKIKSEQAHAPLPAPDEPPAEAKPEEVTARSTGITRELSIDEILKKMESDISGNKPAPVKDQ
jgi:hypothetical protein